MKEIVRRQDPQRQEKLQAFDRLLTVMDELRDNCPWDKKQTTESLRHLTLEEVFELSDAILAGDRQETQKELGDILLHIVFYARIAEENQEWDVASLIHQQCDKLVARHPHIYGDDPADTEEAVLRQWQKNKMQEGRSSILEGVPASLPALLKAYRIQEKAAGVGFDWPRAEQVWAKVEEETEEFHREVKTGNTQAAEEELGDLLFALINYARFQGINPEDALEQANRKFIRRFQDMETQSRHNAQSLSEMSLEEMETLWQEAKTR